MNPHKDYIQINYRLDHNEFMSAWDDLVSDPLWLEYHPRLSVDRRLLRLRDGMRPLLLEGCRLIRHMIKGGGDRGIEVSSYSY